MRRYILTVRSSNSIQGWGLSSLESALHYVEAYSKVGARVTLKSVWVPIG